MCEICTGSLEFEGHVAFVRHSLGQEDPETQYKDIGEVHSAHRSCLGH